MKINGVLGQIDTADLGATFMHEHVSYADWSMRMNFPGVYFEENEMLRIASEALLKAKRFGLQSFVDGTAINLGRDINLIAKAARKTGLNIIASSGFYFQQEPWLSRFTEEDFYDLMFNECTRGIAGTGILPGMMKAAVAGPVITPLNEKILRATARVARDCAMPLFVHHDAHDKTGYAILDIFASVGLEMHRVILGHAGDSNDMTYLEDMLCRGCYLGLDRFSPMEIDNTPEKRIETMAELIRRGWTPRLFPAQDNTPYSTFFLSWEQARAINAEENDMDYTYVYRHVFPALRKMGITEEKINMMLVDNPRRFFEGA